MPELPDNIDEVDEVDDRDSFRLDAQGNTYRVDARGSRYIDFLHQQLHNARLLADEVLSLNPRCETIGAGKLANMRAIAQSITIPL